MKTTIIGIAGGTGSGKSTFTNRLKEAFGNQISVIYYDNYYKDQSNIPFEERKKNELRLSRFIRNRSLDSTSE